MLRLIEWFESYWYREPPRPRGFPEEIYVCIMGNGIQAWEKPPSDCPSIKYVRAK